MSSSVSVRQKRKRPPRWFGFAVWGGIAGVVGVIAGAFALSAP